MINWEEERLKLNALMERRLAGEDVDKQIHEFTNSMLSKFAHAVIDMRYAALDMNYAASLGCHSSLIDSRRADETLSLMLSGIRGVEKIMSERLEELREIRELFSPPDERSEDGKDIQAQREQ